MKSITIHGLDDSLDTLIKDKAIRQGTSINKTIKTLLKESLGIADYQNRKAEFREFCGVWSKADEKRFEKTLRDFEHVDIQDWR